ncbi:MAG: fatty acid cis/trans isomerase [Smithella sp.]|nr:fatty acid cis/trans isomerase [Smithella sp.]
MKYRKAFSLVMIGLFIACATKTLPPVVFNIPTRHIDYLNEVKPLLDKRCAVCHSCYNSPCQLKLDSFEGADRGATKRAVYNGSRLRSMDPTRLFTDAQSTGEWRQKEFFSVTDSKVSGELNDSIMIEILSHKIKNPKSVGEYRSEANDLTCSENTDELAGYLEKHPNNGMPFGFPALKPEEFAIIAGWLVQGAKGPDATRQKVLITPKASDAYAIKQWETFLNLDDAKHAMTTRYLYEHLFLAHIKFGTQTNEYYELFRSKTPPGEPADLVATVRPYDDPGVPRIYYRFRKIHSTIVEKTHMVFTLDDAKMRRVEELFIQPEWLQTPHTVGYEAKMSANPFVAFEQIPPRARYQFLLDNVNYIIMTFIHGPVCKGQIALNVLNDHFWVMFVDPDHDLSVANPAFMKLHSDKLRMPIEAGSDMRIFNALTDKYKKDAVEFYKARQDYYTTHNYAGLGYEFIWKGNTAADAPLLTVYRHFDSASVHRGILGNLPKTMWVVDYPLLERIYYALVAGFDVYGTAGHQLALRLYMDQLRVEGESYFLDFMPASRRQEFMQSSYKGIDLKKIDYYSSALPTKISFVTDEPNREFIEYIVNRHIMPATNIAFDAVNYERGDVAYPGLPDQYETTNEYLKAFRAVSKPGTPFFLLMNDHNIKIAYMRIRLKNGKDLAISIVINQWHSNVTHLFGEKAELDVSKDSADFIPGLIGSYPNYFFDVREEDLPDFFDILAHFDKSPQAFERLAKYGVNRAEDRLWDTYDWFQKRFYEDDPVNSGLFDLNRYYYLAK